MDSAKLYFDPSAAFQLEIGDAEISRRTLAPVSTDAIVANTKRLIRKST